VSEYGLTAPSTHTGHLFTDIARGIPRETNNVTKLVTLHKVVSP